MNIEFLRDNAQYKMGPFLLVLSESKPSSKTFKLVKSVERAAIFCTTKTR